MCVCVCGCVPACGRVRVRASVRGVCVCVGVRVFMRAGSSLSSSLHSSSFCLFSSSCAAGTGTGHESTVWDVCWDPVSRARLASCSDDLTLRLWESRAAPTSTPASAPAGAAAAVVPEGTVGGAGGPQGFVPSRPDLRCAVTLSGHHRRTVFSLDWAPTGLIATGARRPVVKGQQAG